MRDHAVGVYGCALAMKIRFITKEVFEGLSRNVTMTIAVILTVAVSLTHFRDRAAGAPQVETMKDYWYDKVEVLWCSSAEPPRMQPPARPLLPPLSDRRSSQFGRAARGGQVLRVLGRGLQPVP